MFLLLVLLLCLCLFFVNKGASSSCIPKNGKVSSFLDFLIVILGFKWCEIVTNMLDLFLFRYKVIKEVGNGSFGVVWRALNKQNGEVVSPLYKFLLIIMKVRQNYINGPCGSPKVTSSIPANFFDVNGPCGLQNLHGRSFLLNSWGYFCLFTCMESPLVNQRDHLCKLQNLSLWYPKKFSLTVWVHSFSFVWSVQNWNFHADLVLQSKKKGLKLHFLGYHRDQFWKLFLTK